MLILWMSVLGNLLVVSGVFLSIAVGYRGLKIDQFSHRFNATAVGTTRSLSQTITEHFPSLLSKVTPGMVRAFCVGLAMTVLGNLLLLIAATVELLAT